MQHETRLFNFLTLGRSLIGGYDGKIKIGTKKGNIIYQSENFGFNGMIGKWIDDDGRNITKLLKLRVYNYWVDEDGYLFVKVFNNPTLIDKHKKVCV